METQPANTTIDLSVTRRTPGFAQVIGAREVDHDGVMVSTHKLASSRKDALSFSITFAVIALLTGAMLYYQVAVTMSAITSFFFYGSLIGMLVFAIRAIVLQKAVTASA